MLCNKMKLDLPDPPREKEGPPHRSVAFISPSKQLHDLRLDLAGRYTDLYDRGWEGKNIGNKILRIS